MRISELNKLLLIPKRNQKQEKLLIRKLEDKAWELMSRYIRLKDGRCVRCGSTERNQVHHVFSRRYKVVKFDEDNLITLCHKCHTYAEYNEAVFNLWFEDKFPVKWRNICYAMRNGEVPKRTVGEWQELIKYIENKIEGVNKLKDEVYD